MTFDSRRRRSARKQWPWETRMEILRLVKAGVAPKDISRKLNVPLEYIFRQIAWDRHRSLHKGIATDLVEQLREQSQQDP